MVLASHAAAPMRCRSTPGATWWCGTLCSSTDITTLFPTAHTCAHQTLLSAGISQAGPLPSTSRHRLPPRPCCSARRRSRITDNASRPVCGDVCAHGIGRVGEGVSQRWNTQECSSTHRNTQECISTHRNTQATNHQNDHATISQQQPQH